MIINLVTTATEVTAILMNFSGNVSKLNVLCLWKPTSGRGFKSGVDAGLRMQSHQTVIHD